MKKKKYMSIPKPVVITKIFRHPNADSLGIIKYEGREIVVGTNISVGDRVVVFLENVILHPEFLRINNLYGNPELNADPSVTGFFSRAGRVKRKSIRGSVSHGFVATREQFEEMGELVAYKKRVAFACRSEKYFVTRYHSQNDLKYFQRKNRWERKYGV